MALISDYLSEYGGRTFEEVPFNEVDGYILSKIGCPDYTGVIPGTGEPVTVDEAVRRFRELHGEAGGYMGALASPSIAPMIWSLPETERYRALCLSGFRRRILPERTEQFSALTITLPDGRCCVTFRGTDDTLLGWKENLMMSAEETVWAQADAAEYLCWAADTYEGNFVVCGHSKGGNLAVYAAAMAPAEAQARITDVYNFDGPGFLPAFFEEPGYQSIRGRIHTLLPQHSLVGTLLTRERWATIVRASRGGIAAHDGFTWEVKGTAFVRCAVLSPGSRAFEETMDTVLETMSLAERREFVNELFDALTATGAVTLTDLTERRLAQAVAIAGSFRRGTGTRRLVMQVIEIMLKEYAAQMLGFE